MHAGVEAGELKRRLERSVASLCPTWLAQERDDLVQTSLVRILERLREGGVGDLNSTYLWKTAYAVVLDELRRARRRYERPLEGADAAGSHDPESATLEREFVRAVRACLDGLARDRRNAVQLRLAGFPYGDAARILGADAKRTSNLVFRGFEDLRRCLRSKGVTRS